MEQAAYPTGPAALFVAYYASAEIEKEGNCLLLHTRQLALLWQLSFHELDAGEMQPVGQRSAAAHVPPLLSISRALHRTGPRHSNSAAKP
jgi:hypothetical protein